MKNIIFTLLFIFTFSLFANAQQQQKTRKELRADRQEQRKEKVINLLQDKNFVFKPTHAMPLGGGSIYLSHSFDAEIKNDTLISYLPFYGVAYRAEYGARKSAFDFIQPLENFELETTSQGYQVNLEVRNKMDYLSYTFHISELGYATLNVTSTNRQAISYYGSIEAPEEKRE
jgi:hypothetical protein